jgi:hypothetical protein
MQVDCVGLRGWRFEVKVKRRKEEEGRKMKEAILRPNGNGGGK